MKIEICFDEKQNDGDLIELKKLKEDLIASDFDVKFIDKKSPGVKANLSDVLNIVGIGVTTIATFVTLITLWARKTYNLKVSIRGELLEEIDSTDDDAIQRLTNLIKSLPDDSDLKIVVIKISS